MVYLFLALLLVIGIYFFDIKLYTTYKKQMFYVILTVLVSISGFSYRLGTDVIVYMSDYYYYSDSFSDLFNLSYLNSFDHKSPGWIFINVLFRSLGLDFYWLKIIHSCFINSVILLFLKKYSPSLFTSISLYVIILYFPLNFEVLRESISVAFFLLAIYCLTKRKHLCYVGNLLFARCFHVSASVLVLSILAPIVKPSFRKVFLYIIILLSILFLSSGISVVLKEYIFNIDSLSSKSQYYLNSEEYGESLLSINSIINILLNTFFIIIVGYYVSKKHVAYRTIYPFLLMYSGIYTLSLIIPIFYRFNNYFYIFFIITMSYLVNLKLKYISRSLSFFMVRSFLLLYICLKFSVFFNVLNESTYPSYVRYYPYSSIFDKSLDKDREALYRSF